MDATNSTRTLEDPLSPESLVPGAVFKNEGEPAPICARCKVHACYGTLMADPVPEVPPLLGAGGEVIREGMPARPARIAYLSKMCLTCIDTALAEEKAAVEEKKKGGTAKARLEWFRVLWNGGEDEPESVYHNTDTAKLPNRQASKIVLDWHPAKPKEKPSLLLVGDTGAGKTRTVYALLRKLLLNDGIRPVFWKCVRLRQELIKAARSDDGNARDKFLRTLYRAPIVVLDDIGQMATTPTTCEAMYEIVEQLTSQGTPIIVTSQFTGTRFVELFTQKPETGRAVLRRLQDFSETVNF